VSRHGTRGGYNAHRASGERPCDDCRRAHNQAVARWRAATPERIRTARLRAAAQRRAYSRLAAKYPDVYRELYQQEKALLAAEQDEAAG
jgi:hypothetical protein